MLRRFITDTGYELEPISVAVMREIDRLAVEETGPNLFQMMENAGRNLAELTLKILSGEWPQSRILVLAGTGGNGGGGLCAGRHLANRGIPVSYCLTDAHALSGVTAWQLKLLVAAGGQEVAPGDPEAGKADIILDAVIGYSLKGAPSGRAKELIEWANALPARKISLDIPSGVDADNGGSPGAYVRADYTLTLAWPKTGLTPEKTGNLWLGDLGIPPSVYGRAGLANYTSPFNHRYLIPLTETPQV
ncbi:MAG: NAD(P)H-hydrate epimerase [Dehalogenimonas sp.]|uniref:NAD(P)H-hydrate epimerase n=1 Tax=Candidatus Dehalogenimonas loeffleri TaxID=3127115 RepID=A0ABZ2J7P3_9CHLR|nr:NAD(P)H-hydrate epimerase [Dehalogenimonas sp.]